MKYIDAEKLIAEIEKLKEKYGSCVAKDEVQRCYKGGRLIGYEDALYKIASLQQEQPDYKEAVQLVFEEELIPFKDGNQWCFLLGRNLQDGICGFGDTILDAAVDFYKDYMNTKIHIGELKISMAQQDQPEVDFETEYAKFSNDPDALDYAFPIDLADYKDFARHFYELGLNARKEE